MKMIRLTPLLLLLGIFTHGSAIAQPELLFGQVAIGGQGDLAIETVISATNSGSQIYNGVFSFWTGEGVSWNPLVNGAATTNGQHAITIPPNETLSLSLTGTTIESGSASLRGTGPPETAVDGNLTYFFRTAGTLTDSIGVGPSREIYRATLPFQDFSTIALALANQDTSAKNIRLRLRAADGTVAENHQLALVGNGHRPRFLSEFFQTTSVVAGRVDIEADQPIFGTALTLTEGEISTLPLEAARVEYSFRTDAADGTVTLGKITLWAEGFLHVTEEDGVAVAVAPVAVGGRLQDGVLRLAFALSGQFFERSVVGIEFQSFSFELAQLQGDLAEILVDEEEVSTGVVRLTRVLP